MDCQRQELSRNELAEMGAEAMQAVPVLLKCIEDGNNDISVKSMRLAVASAIWKITGDPQMAVALAERLLLDRECWFRRQVCELLTEIAHPAALPALRERQANDVRPEVRTAAGRAMEKIESAT
jgi:HEAT repeat protein